MGILDLNNNLDFAKLTLSDASTILQDFTGKNPADWDILEGSYNGVLFHVFRSKEVYNGALGSISDSGGRRKVKYRFPYKDGQTTDDLGRKPETFEMDILIFGPKYLSGLSKIMNEMNKSTPGELVHPVRGRIKCVPEDFQFLHSSEKRKAVAIRLVFIEHSFTIGEFKSTNDSTVKGALAKALDAFKSIEAAIVKVQGAVTFSSDVRNHVNQLLNRYNKNYSATLGSINKTFNPAGSVDIPGLLPVNEGGLQKSDGSRVDSVFTTVISPSDPFAQIPLDQVSQATATALVSSQITKNVNSLRDDLNVILGLMETGSAALELHDEIVALKKTAILMQDALEKGIASSQTRIVEYTTPRVMSLREVAFANGVLVNRVYELEVLNPSLLSTNYIEAGTSLKVPIS